MILGIASLICSNIIMSRSYVDDVGHHEGDQAQEVHERGKEGESFAGKSFRYVFETRPVGITASCYQKHPSIVGD